MQILSKKFRGKKMFEVAPLHLWFQNKGWPESKVVFRFWLAQIVLALFGVWISLQK
jgi:phospho-N-acetylmuramoyl-pentapeptide-transferase